MATSDLAELSLDEIISRTRKSKTGGARRGAAGAGGARRPSGGVRDRPIQKKRSAKMWDNDKFFEVYGGGRKGGRGAAGSAQGGRSVLRLANVPYNVTQEELETLFEKYRLPKVALHFDQSGRSLGTAELHGSRDLISRVFHDFKGVHIDGRALELTLVGGGGPPSPTVARRVTRPAGGSGAGRRQGGGGARRPQKPKLTAEELDKELEEYMKKSAKA